MKTLGRVINGMAVGATNWRDVLVTGVTCDSREAGKGRIFVAVPGTRRDGHEFIPEAVKAGAGAIVSQKAVYPIPEIPVVIVRDCRKAYAKIAARFNDDPSSRLNVIGVTGTNGKTTTTFLIRSILEAAGERAGLLGTIFNVLGGAPVESEMTTPDAASIQSAMAEMVAAGCRSCVMEVSSHSLTQGRVDAVRFVAGIFTNLTRDHLDYHRTFEAYREAKAGLFDALPPNGIACVNADDPNAAFYAARGPARTRLYGIDRGDIRGEIRELSIHGSHIVIDFDGERLEIHSPLVGRHNVQNLLAAGTCMYSMGYDLEHIRAGLEGARSVPGRLEEISLAQDYKVFVDYAHTPDALERVISALRPLTAGKLIVVFGCGGGSRSGEASAHGGYRGSTGGRVPGNVGQSSKRGARRDRCGDPGGGPVREGGRGAGPPGGHPSGGWARPDRRHDPDRGQGT